MKIAIVTGASSGMGREAVIQLADRFGGGLGEIWAVAGRAAQSGSCAASNSSFGSAEA